MASGLFSASPNHLVSFSLLYGGAVAEICHAVVAHKALKEEEFSRLQADLLPTHFSAQAALSAVALLTYRIGNPVSRGIAGLPAAPITDPALPWLFGDAGITAAPLGTAITVSLPLAASLLNLLWFGPAVRSAKVELAKRIPAGLRELKIDTLSDEDRALYSKFKVYHRASMGAELATVAALTWYAWTELAPRL